MNRPHWVLDLCFVGVVFACFCLLGFSWLKGQETQRVRAARVEAEVRR